MLLKSVTKTTTKSASEIWAKYADVENWNTWDGDTKSSSLDGEFKLGGTGVVEPQDGPKSKITFTKLVPNQALTSTCEMPLAQIDFNYEIKELDANTRQVTHSVELKGFLAPLWKLIIGKALVAGIETSVNNII